MSGAQGNPDQLSVFRSIAQPGSVPGSEPWVTRLTPAARSKFDELGGNPIVLATLRQCGGGTSFPCCFQKQAGLAQMVEQSFRKR